MGGRGTLYGAVLGALSVNYTKSWFTSAYPDAWLFALGALFVLVTLFLPKGLVGMLRPQRFRKAPAVPAAPAPVATPEEKA